MSAVAEFLDDPFHAGERLVQERAGWVMQGAPIRPFMPDQHRLFFARQPVVFMGVAGVDGAPIATALAGQPGFIDSPDASTLTIAAQPDLGDPAAAALRPGAEVGLLGLEFATRRRNRANGRIVSRGTEGFAVRVAQSFGNCPKYIHPREPVAGAAAGPVQRLAGLDSGARALVAAADTFFVASSGGAAAGAKGGVDMSHRGGQAGFVHVAGDRILVPDFRGNRYFNTLGNLVLDNRAGLLFLDFATGGMLQLQGRVEIVWGASGVEAWGLDVERGWWRPGGLGLAWE